MLRGRHAGTQRLQEEVILLNGCSEILNQTRRGTEWREERGFGFIAVVIITVTTITIVVIIIVVIIIVVTTTTTTTIIINNNSLILLQSKQHIIIFNISGFCSFFYLLLLRTILTATIAFHQYLSLSYLLFCLYFKKHCLLTSFPSSSLADSSSFLPCTFFPYRSYISPPLPV